MRLSEWQKYVTDETKKTDSQIDKEILQPNEILQEKYTIKKNVAEEINIAPKQEIINKITNQLQFDALQKPYFDNIAAQQSVLTRNKTMMNNKINENRRKQKTQTKEEDTNSLSLKERQKEKILLERQELLNRLLDPILSLEETAKILNVCKTTVRRYTNEGLISSYRTPGNQRRFRLNDILSFLEKSNKT